MLNPVQIDLEGQVVFKQGLRICFTKAISGGMRDHQMNGVGGRLKPAFYSFFLV